MPSRLAHVPDLLIPIDAGAGVPLHRQVYHGIRDAILSGRVGAGVRIPSTRRLAESWGVSRSTILVAFEKLVAEGYLVGTVGSGSYVARHIPDHLLRVKVETAAALAIADTPPRLAERSIELARMRRRVPTMYPRAFWTGVPPVDVFPSALWSRLAARRSQKLETANFYHGRAAGYQPLRDAIAGHLAASRGVRCSADQVIVLSSAQEALELAARVLLDPGDAAWLEDPVWFGARAAVLAAGGRIVPVAVDAEGLDPRLGMAADPHARLVYVTPSHQFPTGVTMSLERRLALLQWAAAQEAWILEDDYDSEIRFAGHPLTALQGLDAAGRVLYIGTFNKMVFPALRLAYIVVPQSLVDAFLAMRGIGGQHAPTLSQAVLTDFIIGGHFDRNLRRMRLVCEERRDALIDAAQRDAAGLLDVARAGTGLHTIGWLPTGVDDQRASRAAYDHDVEAAPLSSYSIGPAARAGLVLGYAGYPPDEIRAAVRRLAEALRS